MKQGWSEEEQLFLSQALLKPATIEELAVEATSLAQRVEVYMAARLAIDADAPSEHEWLDRLAKAGPPGTELAARLRTALASGALTLRDDPFWSTCLSYHHMPAHVRQELAGADLVLFKGDVNYRRLLDDRHWPHTTRLADIVRNAPSHVPSPFAALRTLKGELIVDLAPGQAEALAAVDPTWMINGQRGIVQFVDPGPGNLPS